MNQPATCLYVHRLSTGMCWPYIWLPRTMFDRIVATQSKVKSSGRSSSELCGRPFGGEAFPIEPGKSILRVRI